MIIKGSSIQKNYGKLQVVKNVDITVNQGEIISIVGKSGAGKTTLLQILGTLLKADNGTIELLNTDIGLLNQKELAKFRNRHIGFVFQFHQLLPEFTAIENACLPALISGKSIDEAQKKAYELFDFLGVSQRALHKPSELSGGEQQRVAVARALINNPAVIFADEPSGNLDTKHKTELHEMFFALRKEFNQTFVIVTHDSHLAQLSDRIITMEDGNILS